MRQYICERKLVVESDLCRSNSHDKQLSINTSKNANQVQINKLVRPQRVEYDFRVDECS